MENCLGKTVFFLLIAFCILFALVGGGVVGFGVYLLLQTRNYYPVFLTDGYVIATYFLIALGGTIVVISSIGLLGSWCAKSKNNKSLIRLFVFIIVNVLIFELFAVFTSSILHTDIQNDVESNMEKALMGYNNNMTEYRTLYPWPGPLIEAFNNTETLNSTQDPNNKDDSSNMNTSSSIDYKQAWDSLQENFQCCGITGKDDWMNMIDISPPRSCYEKQDGNNTYKIGCLKALIHNFFPVIDVIPNTGNALLNENIVTGLAVFVVNLQLFGILVGLCFGCCFEISTDSDTISEKTEDDTEFEYEKVEEKLEVDAAYYNNILEDGTHFEKEDK